jgi:hypothetical protein
MSSTGIALFVYDRPEHTKRVLNALQKNNISELYIFSDGAKNNKNKKSVRRVRDIVTNISWCKTNTITREHNYGLAKSLITGINRVFEDHDQIIVLEDDCVPASNFVSYMKHCLNKYKNDAKVMNVQGYSPPIEIPEEYSYDVYFTYRSSSWGWGTWRDAWNHFEYEPLTLEEIDAKKDKVIAITEKAGEDLYPMMLSQLTGQSDSWAVWWSYAIASNGGLCVNPVGSKIKNIGFEGKGTHSPETNTFEVDLDSTPVEELQFPKKPFINNKINNRLTKIASRGNQSKLKQYAVEVLKYFQIWNAYFKLKMRIKNTYYRRRQ